MNNYQWYHRAKQRVEEFLTELDPELEVEVDETSIALAAGGDDYQTFALIFSHASNPMLHWTMEVQPEEDFIDNQLEDVVRQIYFQRIE